MLFAAVATHAATKYEINVGGQEVTSSNASNVTGGDITVTSGCSSGYVSYVESTNTLTLYNITIHRTGSGDYAIHNRKCDGLTIQFKGKCYFTSDKAAALKLQRNTTLNPFHDSYTEVSGNYTNGTYALDIEGNDITITGMSSAKLYFYAGNEYYGCVTRSGSGSLNFKGYAQVRFENDPPSSFTGTWAPAWRNVYANFYHGSDVHVYGMKHAIYDSYIHTHYDDVEVLIPYGGDYSNAEHVYFSSNYVAIINEDYFPDANFRNHLMNYEGYSKGYITSSDVASRTSFLYLNNRRISDLTGIEYFTNLEQLDCSDNFISGTFNLLKLTKLNYLHCEKNHIRALNLPASMETLVCSDNWMTSLDLTGLSKLKHLDCGSNDFTSLQVNGFSNLYTLECNNNKNLTSLTCNNNKALYSLNVENCTALQTLDCHNNNLDYLYLTGCSKLETLDCSENWLSGIGTLGDCTSLKYLKCSNNRIYGSSMTSLVNYLPTLPSNYTGTFLVIGSGEEQNEITDAQVKIARDKRWLPKKYVNGSWVEITTKGDVNGDGKVNVSDVTALVNMILGVTTMDISRGDIDGNGKVNVSDVTALINLILA